MHTIEHNSFKYTVEPAFRSSFYLSLWRPCDAKAGPPLFRQFYVTYWEMYLAWPEVTGLFVAAGMLEPASAMHVLTINSEEE